VKVEVGTRWEAGETTYADKHKGLMVFLKDSKSEVNQVFGFRGFSPERQTLELKEIEIG
jgi:hypothetical protein